ncbi:hypothetical protein [Frondihabitans cladoniiphilus]|uniref:Uncharacterized protein n=1 Tax=Frondihabitans cladoniiphilus TaxID=715785 RepID=A0ABP8W5G5_9MICO
MTPDEARLSISDLYRATRDAIGGTWEVGTRTWVSCRASSGKEGASFHLGAQRSAADLPDDPSVIAQRVRTLWSSTGIPAEIYFDESIPQYRLSYPRQGAGPGPDGYILRLAVGEKFADFSGSSRCVPGDSYELDLGEVGRHDE